MIGRAGKALRVDESGLSFVRLFFLPHIVVLELFSAPRLVDEGVGGTVLNLRRGMQARDFKALMERSGYIGKCSMSPCPLINATRASTHISS